MFDENLLYLLTRLEAIEKIHIYTHMFAGAEGVDCRNLEKSAF